MTGQIFVTILGVIIGAIVAPIISNKKKRNDK